MCVSLLVACGVDTTERDIVRGVPHAEICAESLNDPAVRIYSCTEAISDDAVSTSIKSNLYFHIGLAWENLGKIDEAFRNFDTAVSLRPNHPTTLGNRGRAHARHDQIEYAERDFTRVIELDQSAAAYIDRAVLYLKIGDLAPSMSDLNTSLQIDPNNYMALFLRGSIHAMKDQYASAEADYKRAIRIDPTRPEAFIGMADVNSGRGEYNRALGDIGKVLEIIPDDSGSLLFRSNTYVRLQEFERALGDLNRANEIKPNDPEILANLAWFLSAVPNAELRDGVLAARLARQSLALDPGFISRIALANALAVQQRYDEALGVIADVIEDLESSKMFGNLNLSRNLKAHFERNSHFEIIPDTAR